MTPRHVVLVLPAILAGCTAEVSSDPAPSEPVVITHVDARGAQQALADVAGMVALDVRTPEEFAEGHLADAVLIDFKAADFEARITELDREVPYVVYCRSGRRSTTALATFERLGFAQVWHLDGGILAWQEASLPIEK